MCVICIYYNIIYVYVYVYVYVMYVYIMIPGAKGLNPHELAYRWVKDLVTRPDRSIKVG